MSVEIQRRISEVLRKNRKRGPELPLKITVNPTIMDRLRKEDEATLVELEEKLKGHLTFVSNSNLHMEEFVISHAETGEELWASSDRS